MYSSSLIDDVWDRVYPFMDLTTHRVLCRAWCHAYRYTGGYALNRVENAPVPNAFVQRRLANLIPGGFGNTRSGNLQRIFKWRTNECRGRGPILHIGRFAICHFNHSMGINFVHFAVLGLQEGCKKARTSGICMHTNDWNTVKPFFDRLLKDGDVMLEKSERSYHLTHTPSDSADYHLLITLWNKWFMHDGSPCAYSTHSGLFVSKDPAYYLKALQKGGNNHD
ncbi:hypothetical protein BDK51DRAFT_31436 [Blyttiomyces helicus]|uniref:Uncharacterized protein n=1 Tax=Blyttiomyces helicus TaxID=388810 RepID=A0A4P9WMA2_9FUNG|nr:hypothetical protein BDK51DRAFT_31436 [Blyttiomyces helicus]|eukprot:RKO92300.1 hypothetical protein BDK51DRAFT_31436 [Blyttiomyces helicus]